MLESLFNKVAGLGPCNFIKEDSDTSDFLWNLQTFKSNYFEEHLWMSTSKLYLKRDSNIGVFLWIMWIIQAKHQCVGLSSIKLQAWRPEGL